MPGHSLSGGRVVARERGELSRSAGNPTTNMQLAELAALTYDFLAAYAGMPDAFQVTLAPGPLHRAEIDVLLLMRSGGPSEVVEWAQTMDTPVQFVHKAGRGYVECNTWTTLHGHSVRVYVHLSPERATALLLAVGVEFGSDSSVELDAGRVRDAARLVGLIEADGPTAEAVLARLETREGGAA